MQSYIENDKENLMHMDNGRACTVGLTLADYRRYSQEHLLTCGLFSTADVRTSRS